MPSKVDSKQKFLDAFPQILDEIEELCHQYGLNQEAIDWFKENLSYNTLDGKLNRGLSVIDTYQILTSRTKLSSDEYNKLALLGWCVELFQAFFLVADDIMDGSITRRGKPCWYKREKIGLLAINDASMLEAVIFVLLKKHFKKENYYIDLIELFHEMILRTELGQLLDLITAPEDVIDLSKFSLQKHSFIVRYKTAYYSFYLPVALAMYITGTATESNLKQALDVLIPLGEYFQIQDDYLDCYGDPSVIGKIGTDIQDNKCSWLVNTALTIATPEQRAILDSNYGKKDKKSEQIIKDLFKELNLHQNYLDYEESIVKDIKKQIDEIDESNGFKKDVITTFLNKIYKRSK